MRPLSVIIKRWIVGSAAALFVEDGVEAALGGQTGRGGSASTGGPPGCSVDDRVIASFGGELGMVFRGGRTLHQSSETL
jgi:hypothetical protein